MNKLLIISLLCCLSYSVKAQTEPKPYGPIPSKAQLQWQETEMYCLIHFGPDTYTDKEWGFGDEDPAIVNPTQFNAMQIVGAAKAGGFKGVVVVAKHHDGFCLWPTKTTLHNISHSPYKNGKGDLVQEYKEACDKLGMKLGIYCSPWDRNSALYSSPAYVTDVYRKQLEELYTNYGPLFITWFDGANGGDGYYGGAKEIRKIDRSTYYGWDTTWGIVRKLQPDAAVFGDVGPDVRWVGNENGIAGATSWATYTPHAPEEGKAPGNGFTKDKEGIEGQRDGKYWMPAECDVALRPGWFYHVTKENKQSSDYTSTTDPDNIAKSPEALMQLYYKSVGRGACLDLGLAPNKLGLLSSYDVTNLKLFGLMIKNTFAENLAKGADLQASNIRFGIRRMFTPNNLLDNDRYSYWATDDTCKAPSLILNLHQNKTFDVVRLRENIKLGQRIEGIAVDIFEKGAWREIATATSIGGNRLIHLSAPVTASKVRLRVTKSPVCIALSDFGLYKEEKIGDLETTILN
jgi:alpha-L-fucosidase